MATVVNVDNFVRAETDRMFAELQKDAGGVNTWTHSRRPTAIAHQTVIRTNRDTLYSFAVVDISEGATLSPPDAGERYLSAMVVDRDHYINGLYHEPGDYHLTVREFDTLWVSWRSPGSAWTEARWPSWPMRMRLGTGTRSKSKGRSAAARW
jgi:hypothetical protein